MSDKSTAKKAAQGSVKELEGLVYVEFRNIDEAVSFYDTQMPGKGEEAVTELINRAARGVQASIAHNAHAKGKTVAEINVLLAAHSPKMAGEHKVKWTVTKAREAILGILPSLSSRKEVVAKLAELLASNKTLEAISYLESENITLTFPEDKEEETQPTDA